jgi:hypothetical protein
MHAGKAVYAGRTLTEQLCQLRKFSILGNQPNARA